MSFYREWDTPGNLLVKELEDKTTFHDFISQHNESRKLFPKLLYYFSAKTIGLNIKHIVFLRYFIIILILCFVYHHIKESANNVNLLIKTFLISLLICIPTQSLSLLYIQIITIVPPLCIFLFLLSSLF